MHSWVRSQERKRRHRRFAGEGQELPGRLADAGHRRGGPGGEAAAGRLDALGAQHRGDELAEDDRLAVGDEVGLAGPALLGGEDQALDDVVDVGRVGDVARRRRPKPNCPPRPWRPSPAAASCRPCPRRSAVAARRSRSPRGWRRAPPARPWPSSPGRAPASRAAAAPSRRRGPAARRPSAPPRCRSGRSAPRRPLRRRRGVAGALDVAPLEVLPRPPLAEVGGEVEGDVGPVGAGGERGAIAEVAADRLGAERGDALAAASERARARTVRPSRRGARSAAADKPDPPVTKRHPPSERCYSCGEGRDIWLIAPRMSSALVTGAPTGIGRATALRLDAGMAGLRGGRARGDGESLREAGQIGWRR